MLEPGAQGANSSEASSRGGFWALAVGSVGVVYGDIGTSPLYALKESIQHAGSIGTLRDNVIGIVSLLIWALIVVVTLKYVVFIMRADNKGEGGTLSLMALAQSAVGRGFGPAMLLGVTGAALFYGDSIITPAVSVMSAVEGLKLVTPVFEPYIVSICIVILLGLFAVQSRGTSRVAAFFGPVMVLWFLTLAALGILHVGDDTGIFNAFNPYYAALFLSKNGLIGLIVLGSVFLAVTGAEALYADMGHFGRQPIRYAWMLLVFPSLVLNYLGQGAMVLKNPSLARDPFFLMAPDWGLLPLVILSACAAIIASQAVITGAFSLTQQAIQLGLLPRLQIRHTSETQAGQIYLPRVNWLLCLGVILLVAAFRNSSNLASAYGIAVTGAMLADAGLFFIVMRFVWKWPLWKAAGIAVPFLIVDAVFFSANLLKLFDGAYLPLIFGAILVVTLWTWVRGTGILYDKARRDSVPMSDLVRMLTKSKPVRVPGTAVFLTSDPETAPAALLHNLKHNRVLHKRNVILTIKSADIPRVAEADQLAIRDLSDDIKLCVCTLGYMQTPRVPHILANARRKGLDFEMMQTSFFLGRRTIKASHQSGMPLWQDKVYISLSRSAINATDFFHIPYGRVVEMGSQITV